MLRREVSLQRRHPLKVMDTMRTGGGERVGRQVQTASHNRLHHFSSCLRLTQNFLEKSTERETHQEYALAMIQCKVLKQLENLEQQKYDDEDISEDIKFLLEKLGESVQDLRCAVLFDSHGLAIPGCCLASYFKEVSICY